MPKMSVKWHEDCLRNNRRHIEREKENLLRQIKMYRDSRDLLRFKEQQLAEAKRRGVQEYDSERLCVKRKKKEE